MKKRVLALLLSVLMTLSLLPVSAFAANLDGTDLGEFIGTTTEGNFTDEKADPDTSYEYTIVGDDGSQQTVTVTAAGDTGDVDTTYGTIGKTTGSGATYYELVTNGAAGIVDGQQYLIVSANTDSGYALTKTAGAAAVTIESNKITTVDTNAVFTLVSDGNGGHYLNGNGTYLIVSYGSLSTSQSRRTAWTISGNNAVQISYSSYGYARYIVFSAASGTPTFAYNGQTSGRNLYLFAEKTEPSGTVYEVNWSTAADDLLAECNKLKGKNYTAESWAPFQEALDAANAARSTDTFDSEDAARAALDTMTALAEAKAKLVAGDVFYPDIEWQRTKELKYNQTGKGDLLTGQTFTDEGDDGTYPKVYWNWDTVSKLTTDPTMTVWDYGTANQYSSKTSNSNIKAATWVHRNSSGATPSWSCEASVRKFAGTFQWPEGYDLDDTAALVSVNDSYYQPIYDYIANSGNQDYIKATAGKYVLPANDDIYVFMYADGDEPTANNYMNYLVFWTGTSGKGVWSSGDNRKDDWGKTTPSTFNDIYANRSFHGVTPNLWDTKATNTEANDLSGYMDTSLLNQSDSWYTFADTAGIAKVLKNNYTTIDAGTNMHIDIYCFDNDGDGGMDQLELKMVRTPETHTKVEVRYYLDTVDDTGYLGNSFMQNVEVNTKITLQNGTDSNQLNYMKATAIAKAGNKTVTDGKQLGSVPYTVIAYKDNVINVLYTTGDSRYGTATYTYDFGVANQYDHAFTDDINQLGTIESITVPQSFADRVTVDKDANTITYTPKTVNISETVSLTLTFENSPAKIIKDITFLPESNVMYEENMVTAGSSWTEVQDDTYADQDSPTNIDGKLVKVHDDAYGYTDAYADDTKFSGGSALCAKLTEKQVTGTATFTFTGTGFDLISECGTDTGMLVVGVKNASGKAVKAYVVDTYFCGDEEYVKGNGILDYQVPVVRSLNELDYGSYTVTVAGYLASSAGALTKNAVATQSLSNAVPSADDILRAAGMSEYLDAGVEVSFMDDNSVLNGGTGPAVTVTTPSFFSRVRSFFRGLASTQAATADSSSNIYAYIDAFRVYQPLETDPDVYAKTEQDTNYYSLYDFVKNSVNDLSDYAKNAAVYIEYDGSTGVANIADYKDQGPENEVYLAPGSAIVFGLQGYKDGDTVQVSAKQISDANAIAGDGISIDTTSTEMYYDVEVHDDALDDLGMYYVVISNDNTADGILSLSALKVSSGITVVASTALANYAIKSSKDVETAFSPEMLTVSAPESTKVKRSYTIKVQSSKDVDHITIQPKDGAAIELTPTNKKAADAGKVQYYSFSKAFKQTVAGTYTYTVIAYDSAESASAPVTVTVEVTAK